MRRIRAAWPLDILDALALVGLVLLAYGCSLVTPPLAWIVTGSLLLIYAFVAALPPRGEP
jgi:hypothetical protein